MPKNSDTQYVEIKVHKSVSATGVKQIKEFAKRLETDKIFSQKVTRKIINELSKEINIKAWDKILEKFDIKPS